MQQYIEIGPLALKCFTNQKITTIENCLRDLEKDYTVGFSEEGKIFGTIELKQAPVIDSKPFLSETNLTVSQI